MYTQDQRKADITLEMSAFSMWVCIYMYVYIYIYPLNAFFWNISNFMKRLNHQITSVTDKKKSKINEW